MKVRKKLIEVALPLEAINIASAREKSIRHGHPSTLHLWWARRPLAAARAVIFSQMVDDPSTYVEVLLRDPKIRRRVEGTLRARRVVWGEAKATSEKAKSAGIDAPEPGPEPTLDEIAAEIERERLFAIIRELVLWENTNNDRVLQAARDEIWQSWRRACADNADHPKARELFNRSVLPAFHDPFAGGGSIPLEAQRLGLASYASDLNPVAVLITKAMIQMPPKFAARPPINPDARGQRSLIDRKWEGAQGLAEDVRYYGQWMRDEAEKRIGHLYPKVEVTAEVAKDRPDLKPYIGRSLTVIAWLWVRTVPSPNPAFADVDVPLASTFILSTKSGQETYVDPIVEGRGYRFSVRVGKPRDAFRAKNGTKLSRGSNFECLMSATPIPPEHIYAEALGGRMGERLMAIVADGEPGRLYLAPTFEHEKAARSAQPRWKPDLAMPENPRWFSPPLYGLRTYGDLFTPRQLVALDTFSGLVQEARARAASDARDGGFTQDDEPAGKGGLHASDYASAIGLYLAFAVDKGANYWSSLCAWHQTRPGIVSTFGRQALPMIWDFAEANPLSDSSGNSMTGIRQAAELLTDLRSELPGFATQDDAATQSITSGKVVSTDPPYYDNIGYADLSDFFYVWLRRSQASVFPELFETLAVPKAQELVAIPLRHGGKEGAERFFLEGMTAAMHRLAEQAHPSYPLTIYYAFRQSEREGDSGVVSTGWETFLDAVLRAGLSVTGTWPVRTEYVGNLKKNVSALASSIVLVCQRRPDGARSATRREFSTELKKELPGAIARLQSGNIAPVDLAQAAIGPGMAVYTRFSKVIDADGKQISVRDALGLINRTLAEVLEDQEGDFDGDSRWALMWFEQMGFAEGPFGVAEQLSKSKNTSVGGMVSAGFLQAGRGKVRLLRPNELTPEWDPATDRRLTAWETVHHLIRVLESESEEATAALVAKLGAKAENARQLCYRLYTICESKGRAPEALSYNGLVQSWPEIARLARESSRIRPEQSSLFSDDGGA